MLQNPAGGVRSRYSIIIKRSEETCDQNTDQDSHGLVDYKFFCFNGRAEFLYVMGDRVTGSSVSVRLLDRDFNPLPVKRVGDAILSNVRKPENYVDLRQAAERLADGFPHVRVDLFDEDGDIRFGELTFYNASGYMEYDPDSFDYEAGKYFVLPDILTEIGGYSPVIIVTCKLCAVQPDWRCAA